MASSWKRTHHIRDNVSFKLDQIAPFLVPYHSIRFIEMISSFSKECGFVRQNSIRSNWLLNSSYKVNKHKLRQLCCLITLILINTWTRFNWSKNSLFFSPNLISTVCVNFFFWRECFVWAIFLVWTKLVQLRKWLKTLVFLFQISQKKQQTTALENFTLLKRNQATLIWKTLCKKIWFFA